MMRRISAVIPPIPFFCLTYGSFLTALFIMLFSKLFGCNSKDLITISNKSKAHLGFCLFCHYLLLMIQGCCLSPYQPHYRPNLESKSIQSSPYQYFSRIMKQTEISEQWKVLEKCWSNLPLNVYRKYITQYVVV